MLVSMKEMLDHAKANHYAIPAFDISNYDMMKAVLEACEEEGSPALLMALEADLQGRDMDLLSSMVAAASEHFRIPVCLHLDHATDFEYIKRACDAGFSSVMFDGSTLPLEENIRQTRQIVDYAHARGITVEAELGHVGNAMVGDGSGCTEGDDAEESLTLPSEVALFVERTQVDALAVAIGTSHGVYKKTPSLRIDRLDEIVAVCDIPLVLHGGSGTPHDQLQEAIHHGITKINIFSDLVDAMNAGLTAKLNSITNPSTWPAIVFADARARMKQVVKNSIRSFGSAGRV